MVTLTPEAAIQIFKAAKLGEMQGLALRIDAKRDAAGNIGYNMGFDEIREGDVHLVSEGVDVIFADTCKALLNGTTLDFVELEPDHFSFIFLNPNDPSYLPPQS
jgi:iron-sulfur cluster assembly protein